MNPLENAIRNVPDFPKPGIQFKDVTPLLGNGPLFREAIDRLAARHAESDVEAIVGIEARGFIVGAALAHALGTGFCPVRKPGKLPGSVFRKTYDLEYGTDTLEIHADALEGCRRILLADDLLATGGTASATAELLAERFDLDIVEALFLVELTFLNGRDRLAPLPVFSLVQYDA